MFRAAIVWAALLLALPALAAPTPPGLNLRWDQCYSDGGVMNKNFACDTNTGSERLVMSVVLDTDLADVGGLEIRMFVQSANPTFSAFPSWWTFKNAGSCRTSSMSLSFAPPPGAVNCVDWAGGLADGGIGAYAIGVAAPNSALLSAVTAVADPVTMFAGQEYFIGSILISHAKTVGTGACLGCDQPVCIVFDRLNLDTPVPANNRRLFGGANGPDSQFARWQGGHEANVAITGCEGVDLGCRHQFTCLPASATGMRGSTWGAVKALYR